MDKENVKKTADEIIADEAQKVVVEALKPAKDEKEGIVEDVDGYLNVRKTPKIEDTNVLEKVNKGTKVMVMSPDKPVSNVDGQWYKLRFGNPPKEGYALKKYIRLI